MNIDSQPFGAFALPPWHRLLLRAAQNQPANWIGRRLALLLRRIVLARKQVCIDGEAEGLRIRAHVTDNVSERKFLFMPQFSDPYERNYVRQNLSPDGVFLDIGANAGVYTLGAARSFAEMGGSGFVLAVEANPTMQERLRFNVELNKLQAHVRIAPFAVSDRTGEVEFTISKTNLGESGLSTVGPTKLRVPSKTLFDLLNDNGIKRVEGMKIDVEGVEDLILTPFLEQAQRTQLPAFIIIENSTNRWRTDLLGLLARKGYQIQMKCKMNLILSLQ